MATEKVKVGEIRPSQLLYSFGVGSIIDLPYLSTMVLGLDEWDRVHMRPITEERLLRAVQEREGFGRVEQLLAPPTPRDTGGLASGPFDPNKVIGVPVRSFPRWLRCPLCNRLAPITANGLFRLDDDPVYPDRNKYVHHNCNKTKGRPPAALPARFLVACEHGHMDDFPWVEFVHRGKTDCQPRLSLFEFGASGTAANILVKCDSCTDKKRSMAEAFDEDLSEPAFRCKGRHPHLRTAGECDQMAKPLMLGASNAWFSIILSLLFVPTQVDNLDQLVSEKWDILKEVSNVDNLRPLRKLNLLPSLEEYADEQILDSVSRKKDGTPSGSDSDPTDLKRPEWEAISSGDTSKSSTDFQIKVVKPPHGYEALIEKVVLLERLREVMALVGFTRIESPGELGIGGELPEENLASISRKEPEWVPACEVRGEGIFIQFREDQLLNWCNDNQVRDRDARLYDAHQRWRLARRLEPAAAGYPGMRFVVLHSFAHALMRQLCLECGYSSSSIRERIYSREAGEPGGPMAGVLIYTAAPDSEGTLGGLVNLGKPESLGRHIGMAMRQMKLCASDPLCAENDPTVANITLHAAACHACLFAPETACERGNKYLDRNVLVQTFGSDVVGFFDRVLVRT